MKFEPLAERAKIEGVNGFSAHELLAIITSRRPEDADGCLKAVVDFGRERGGIDGYDINDRDLWQMRFGLEEYEITRMQAAVRLGEMLAVQKDTERPNMTSPDAVYKEMRSLLKDEQEQFYLLLLDTKCRLKRKVLLHIGTLDTSLVGVREVFRIAVRDAASSIICVHNHPSGDPTPSIEDISITNRLIQVGRQLEIPLSDHLIVAKGGFTSLRLDGHVNFTGA